MKRNPVRFVLFLMCLVFATSNSLSQTDGVFVYDSHFTSVHFSGSGNCAACHDGLVDPTGRDVSIVKDWSSILMANSTRDPLWKAKLRSELNRTPDLTEALNKKCTRCHAPMANTEAAYLGDPIIAFGEFLEPGTLHYAEAMDGVSCTLCHQISDDPNLAISGGFIIDTFLDPTERPSYGPYTNLFTQPMINGVQYTPQYSQHIKESKLCATCHDLKTPYVDEKGDVISTPESEFPEQMPYSEWEHSDYVKQKKSCQDCHYPRVDRVPIASRPTWLRKRNNFGIHQMVGGNLLLLDILDANRKELGVTGTNFGAIDDATTQMLNGAATIDLVQSSLVDGQLEFTLKISSNTGHKLPSGIPLRRIILHVTVTDDQGLIVFESGRVNPNGSVFGAESDDNPTALEPHHDLITDEDQVQIYEGIMQNNLEEVTYTLLRAMAFKKDNRLLPAGFDKTTADSDIQVVGEALADEDFQGGSDSVSYSISGMTTNQYTVNAELIYQAVSYPFVQDLALDDSPEVSTFWNMFDASGQKSISMGSYQFLVTQ